MDRVLEKQFRRKHLGELWEWWHRNAFHYRLRDAREYSEKWQYVRENPIRKNLLKKMDDWRFRGAIHTLRWAGTRSTALPDSSLASGESA